MYFILGPIVAVLCFFAFAKPEIDAFPNNTWFQSPNITNCFFFFYARHNGKDFIGICYHWLDIHALADSGTPIVADIARFLTEKQAVPAAPDRMEDRMNLAFRRAQDGDKSQCAAAMDMAKRLGNHFIVVEAAKLLDTEQGYKDAFSHLVAHEEFNCAKEIMAKCSVDVLLAYAEDCARGKADEILRHSGLRLLARDQGDIIGLDNHVRTWLEVQPSLVSRRGVAFLVDILYAVQNQDLNRYEDLCFWEDEFRALEDWETSALWRAKPSACEVDLT